MRRWPRDGLPDHPRRLIRTAFNKAIDDLRRRAREDLQADPASDAISRHPNSSEHAHDPDDRLRLMFTCLPPFSPSRRRSRSRCARSQASAPRRSRARSRAAVDGAAARTRRRRSARRASLPRARRRPACPSASACRPGHRLPRLQRGLRRHLGRRSRAARAVGRGHASGACSSMADARWLHLGCSHSCCCTIRGATRVRSRGDQCLLEDRDRAGIKAQIREGPRARRDSASCGRGPADAFAPRTLIAALHARAAARPTPTGNRSSRSTRTCSRCGQRPSSCSITPSPARHGAGPPPRPTMLLDQLAEGNMLPRYPFGCQQLA